MSSQQYDAIVIGSGQGGKPLSTALAQGGKRTALIERDHIGGTCVNTGCTPTKTMLASGRVAYLAGRAADYGVRTGPISIDLQKVRQRKRDIVEFFRSRSQSSLESTANLDLIFGNARFSGPRSLEVSLKDGGQRSLSATKIFIDAGTRSALPRFPVDDPHYRILARQRSRYTHYYFYIRDEVLGPMALCVGSFLPFSITCYLNGHHFIERELQRAGVEFRKDDNAFLWVADAQALQAAADRLSPQIIRQQLDHWTWVVGPKFSQKDRAAINLSRHYSLQQIEYCRNFIFRRNFPIHKLFQRSCDLGLFRLTADKLSQVFGFRLHKRIRGKLATVLEKMDHGHHVLRACGKNAVLRMYEKFSTFLRLEALSNNLKDFG